MDLIDSVDITIAYGLGASVDVALWRDVNKATPYDVLPPPVSAYVWNRLGGSVLATFAAEKIDRNVVRLDAHRRAGRQPADPSAGGRCRSPRAAA